MSEITENSDVRIFEVGARDGLQNESKLLSVDQKVALIHRLIDSGVRDVEIGSFVHPKWIPQLADTEQVAANIKRMPHVNYWALVPNRRGLERALESELTHIAVFMSASESHNRKNLNASLDESLSNLAETCRLASENSLVVRAYISTVFGCPYEGNVDFSRVMEIASRLFDFGVTHISLGDTIGAGVPPQVQQGCRQALDMFGPERVALHLHDTQGLGLVNSYVAYNEGVRLFDSAVGGIGGCPYAPGATGNLGTEDLLNLFAGLDVHTGVDINTICETSRWLSQSVGIRIPSKFFQYWATKH